MTIFLPHFPTWKSWQPKSTDQLLSGLAVVASRDCRMKTATEGVCRTFREIFTLFGKCHNTYNAMVVDDPLIDLLGKVSYT